MKYLIALVSTLSLSAWSSTVEKTPYLRLDGAIYYPQLSPNSQLLAYADNRDRGLKIIDLRSRAISEISQHLVGDSFFWAPDSFRIFYREMYQTDGQVYSEIKAYDLALGRSVSIVKIPGNSGLLTFDPRDMRLYLMTEKGIVRRKLSYPSRRLSKWQRALANKYGYWVAAQNRIVWLSANGLSMRPMGKKASPIQSFDISRDGQKIVWADRQQHIYFSVQGGARTKLARGLDPKWHPSGRYIVFAKAVELAGKIIDHDIAISDLQGSNKVLTPSLHSDERFPVWVPASETILYTKLDSTDIFEISFRL